MRWSMLFDQLNFGPICSLALSRRRMKKHSACWLLLILVFTSLSSYSQTATASISGIVTDPQRAVIPNATVVARNEATGTEQRTVTTSDGLYNFPHLQVGTYDVRVETASFSKSEAKAIKLQVGERRDVNFQLQVGAVTQAVEVTAAVPLI